MREFSAYFAYLARIIPCSRLQIVPFAANSRPIPGQTPAKTAPGARTESGQKRPYTRARRKTANHAPGQKGRRRSGVFARLRRPGEMIADSTGYFAVLSVQFWQ